MNKTEFMGENDAIYEKMVVTNAGDSATMKEGQMVTARKLRDENSALKRKDAKPVEARHAKPATARIMLQGIKMCIRDSPCPRRASRNRSTCCSTSSVAWP